MTDLETRVYLCLAGVIADDLNGESTLPAVWNSFTDDEQPEVEQVMRDIRALLLRQVHEDAHAMA